MRKSTFHQAFLMILAIWSSSQSPLNFKYCPLPETIYKDGISSVSFGKGGWNYNNAAQWKGKHKLNIIKDFVVTCGGSQQSPIDINTAISTESTSNPQINFIIKSSNTKYEENTDVPFTRQFDGEFSQIVALDSSGQLYKYVARQFHVHTPSEHTVDGKSFDMELHFVHQAIEDNSQSCKDIEKKLSVFALFFKETEDKEDFEVFEPWFDPNLNEIQSFDLNIFLQKLSDKTYYQYYGSLTNIPCQQTVIWYVFVNPLPISKTQLTKLKALFADPTLYPSGNNRPLQNMNNRKLFKGNGNFAAIQKEQLALIEKSASLIATMLIMIIYII